VPVAQRGHTRPGRARLGRARPPTSGAGDRLADLRPRSRRSRRGGPGARDLRVRRGRLGAPPRYEGRPSPPRSGGGAADRPVGREAAAQCPGRSRLCRRAPRTRGGARPDR
jgi:hypothetical protein